MKTLTKEHAHLLSTVRVVQVSEAALALREPVSDLAQLVASADRYRASARSPRTQEAYLWQWQRFERWCSLRALTPMPASPETVRLYITSLADEGLARSTIAQALAALAEWHRAVGQPSPVEARDVRETWKGIRRTLRERRPRRVAPLLVEQLSDVFARLDDSKRAFRDRSLLTMGFAGAFRRSELVAIDVENVEFADTGLVIDVEASKTDQEGEGTKIGIPAGSVPLRCPVGCLREWLDRAEISNGAVFRAVDRHGNVRGRLAARDVARILKRLVGNAGLDFKDYSGHSLRSGLATCAARSGKSDRAIMRQGRWRSRQMLDRYVRDATPLVDNAADGLL